MAYQNIVYQKESNMLHLWDDEQGYSSFPYKHYGYIVDKKGDYITMDGKRVKKTTDFEQLSKIYSPNLYESDLDPEVRTLIDLYSDSDAPSKNHRELILDIEVKSDSGFPMPDTAEKEITAIAFYYKPLKLYCAYILDEEGVLEKQKSENKIVIPCRTEKELLIEFYKKYTQIQPTIISGWNSAWFDIPYLYNRASQILGTSIANQLSPIGIVEWSNLNRTYRIYGVTHFDYMLLYKKFVPNDKTSYSLDNICKDELDHGKIIFTGSLDNLFKTDINKYIEYNINDVVLIVELDEKLDFIELARGLCHKGHTPYEDIWMPSKYIDGAALVYLKRNKLVAKNKRHTKKYKLKRKHTIGETILQVDSNISENTPLCGTINVRKSKSKYIVCEYVDHEKDHFILKNPLEEILFETYEFSFAFEGAFVQEPVPGLYDWIIDLDLTSMYPSNIMTLNISPETKIGRVLEFNMDLFQKDLTHKFRVQIGYDLVLMSCEKLKEYLESNKYSLASNGVFYRTDIKGLIPTILETWFAERKENSALAEKYGNEGNTVLYKYHDSLQYTLKILLNTFYGVLGLPSFRFYDIENADAVTHTGRSLILYSKKVANFYYQKQFPNIIESNIYADTDSLFLSLRPVLEAKYPGIDITDKIKVPELIIKDAKEIQNFINQSYDLYAKKFHLVDKHKWFIKQEIVATKMFLLAKKRYAMWIINKKGVAKNEMEVKGIDVVRSNFPKEFRTVTEDILKSILQDAKKSEIDAKIFDLKDKMQTFNALNIMFPVGVKDMNEHENTELFRYGKGTPAHYKAALAYNDLLKLWQFDNFRPLRDGDKIKWTYLRQNPMNLESIALTGDNDPPKIVELAEKYMDREKNFNSVLVNKLNDFYAALGWGSVPTSDKIDMFFDV